MSTPLSNIKLLANVDIKKDYKNSFTFVSAGVQSSFFASKTVNTRGNLSYIRKENVIRYDGVADDLFNISYLMFQNLNFGSKYFYAFVTDVKYINEHVAFITFKIDVIQSWYFELNYLDSYIEREHVDSDIPGDHRIEENLNTGEYVIRSIDTFQDLNDLAILVSTSQVPDGSGGFNDAIGKRFSGIYSGTGLVAFDGVTGITALNLFIIDITANSAGKGSSIVSIFMIPKILLPSFTDGDEITVPNSLTVDFNYTKNLTDIDGYVPKNSKLFIYPYNMLYVTNFNGSIAEFRYELSDVSNMQYFATCNVSANPVVALVPKNYKGAIVNHDEILRLSDYAQCSWTIDSFLNYVAQNAVNAPINIATGGIQAIMGNPGGLAQGITATSNFITGGIQAIRQPNQVKGSVGGGANTGIGVQTFGFYPKTITEEYAKIIDNYFDRFGYLVNELKIPNFVSRTNWNYIKMRESNIFGNLNNNDLELVNKIFEEGITFWHNDNVGNYNRTNAIL